MSMGSPVAGTDRSYLAEDMMVATHLSWLRGFLEQVAPDVVPKVDMAIRAEKKLRDKLYDEREARGWGRS